MLFVIVTKGEKVGQYRTLSGMNRRISTVCSPVGSLKNVFLGESMQFNQSPECVFPGKHKF